MFDILFGWRKASKCKKLIRIVRCRLKLLKNKRCSIVRQLRDDVAQLLRNGHDHIAFNRVEQLYKDESIVAVYDLLDHFCEFILTHLSYIRRHKDCPNDINEAVSTLIFASARCGDLPELLAIRKLFGERYSQRFAMTALELLPGNLVNRQIKENLSIKSVADDVKYRLVDEIARSCLQPGPLALEYSSELQQLQAEKNCEDRFQDSDDKTNHNRTEASQTQASKATESEGKTVCISFLFDNEKLLTEQCFSPQYDESLRETDEFLIIKKEEKEDKHTVSEEFRIPETSTLKPEERKMAAESSSESSPRLPEEMIYLDDIEEFRSPMKKDGSCQDQRLFMFKSSIHPKNEKFQDGYCESWCEKAGTRKAGGKRLRRKSISREESGMSDVEYAIYYGGSCRNSPNRSRKYYKKIQMNGTQKSCGQEGVKKSCYVKTINECNLEYPCHFYANDENEDLGIPSWKQTRDITSLEGFSAYNVEGKKLQNGTCHCCCSCNRESKNKEVGFPFPPEKSRRNYSKIAKMSESKKVEESEGSDLLGGRASTCSCSSASSQWTRSETQPPYLRAMTMPQERPKESWNDNILRSNSFPFQQPSDLRCSSPHVHPKLPDYDELAAKFSALKKANSQSKHH